MKRYTPQELEAIKREEINGKGRLNDTAILPQLFAQARERNEIVVPIHSDEECETCGSHLEHPITGYCFVCDTDNWERIIY